MKKIYINEEYCIGCRLCEIYCQVKHSKSKKIIKAFKDEQQDMVSRVLVEEIGHNSFAIQCRHCVDAPCVDACISGAMTKNENTGIVNCNEDKCVGCWSCIMVCPYGVIKRDFSSKRVASKCDFCVDEKIPVCVKNCPSEALKFYNTDENDADFDTGANPDSGTDACSVSNFGSSSNSGSGHGAGDDSGTDIVNADNYDARNIVNTGADTNNNTNRKVGD